MQKKSLRSKIASASFAISVGVLVIVSAVYAASAKDMRFYLQANDGGCTSQLGYGQHTDFVNKTTGLGFARWVSDANGYDPDCYRVNLELASLAPVADINKDFRACLQFADYISLDSKGQVSGLGGAGTQQCTPWASEGGGASNWATDSNSYDPDGANLEIETRALPAGTIINDVRLGLQMSDGACKQQAGTVQYTPWASAGGGWSNFAADSNGYDPDCGKVYLETKVSTPTSCSEADEKTVSFTSNGGEPFSITANPGHLSPTTGQTVTVGLAQYWANPLPGSSWISYDKKSALKGQGPAGGTAVAVTETVTIEGTPTGGTITVMADDALEVKVNGTSVFTHTNLADWLFANSKTFSVPASVLKTGTNTVVFTFSQRNPDDASSMGLDYSGSFTSSAGGTAGGACCPAGEAIVCPNQKVLSLANNAGSPGEGKQYAVGTRKPDVGGTSIPSVFNISNNLTYETWVFKTGNNRYGGIITVGEGFPDGSGQVGDLRKNGWPSWYFYGDKNGVNGATDGRGLMFRAGRSSKEKQCTGGCHEYSLGQDIPLGKWTHIAVTVANGQTLSWYVNGALAKQETLAGWDISQTPTQDKVWLGVDPPGLPEFVNAKLDEVRIWNVARTASQIKGAMNKRLTGTEAGLVDYWNFDGNSAADLTGHTNALQLKNGASITADPAIAPLKLCTTDTCVQPPPPTSGDIRVDRVQGTALTPITGSSAYLDSGTSGVTTNPAMFLMVSVGGHIVKVSDSSGTEEIGQCTFSRGGTLCTPVSFTPVTAGSCDSHTCAVSITVTDGKVTRVVARYATVEIPHCGNGICEANLGETTLTCPVDCPAIPPLPPSCSDGIDNDHDGLIDDSDTLDCSPDAPGGPHGESAVGPTCTLTATPATIVVNVGSSKLEWHCSVGPVLLTDNNPLFTDIGSQPGNTGSINVAPDRTTVFTVTAGGATASTTVTVGGSVIDETGGL